MRVVYLEPYPKSYAEELHSDSIEIDGDGSDGRVGFQRFIGISPYRYRDLFEKGKRKYSTGRIQEWNKGVMRPMIEILYPSYFRAETFAVELLEDKLKSIASRGKLKRGIKRAVKKPAQRRTPRSKKRR